MMIRKIETVLSNHQPEELSAEHQLRDAAAVLIPLVLNDALEMLLTERAGKLKHHGGEVAFPGGRQDQTDPDLEFTALRETEEELGISADDVHIIGRLRPFISKYGLAVTPFIGVIGDVVIKPSPDEIASVFTVPLDFFDSLPARIDMITRHGESHRVPVHIYEGYEIWGLTAMIIEHFLQVVDIPTR